MNEILARMREMHLKDSQSGISKEDQSKEVMNKLIADLKIQKGALKKQEFEAKGESDSDAQNEDRSSASEPFTPATDSFDVISRGDPQEPEYNHLDIQEMVRVKQELAAAKSVINRQEQELAESRNLKHTIDQAIGPASEVDFGNRGEMTEDTIHHLQGAFNATARPFTARADWHPNEDTRSDNSETLSAGGYNRGRGIWNGTNQPAYGANFAQPLLQQPSLADGRNSQAAWSVASVAAGNQGTLPTSQRVFSGPSVPTHGFEGRFGDDASHFNGGGMRRATTQYNRPNSAYNNRAGQFGGNFGVALPALATSSSTIVPFGYGGPLGYQPRPIGTPLSPTASEFTANSLPGTGNGWSTVSNCLRPLDIFFNTHAGQQCRWSNLCHAIGAHELSSSS
jgi:hypothetical protein